MLQTRNDLCFELCEQITYYLASFNFNKGK